MFYHLEGVVSEILPNLVVLDCHGIGFALNTTNNTISYLHTGDKAKLFVAEAIGENNFDLYGFYAKSEKRCFEMLISVSGIGPKAALSILSYNTPDGLALSIMNNDERALTVAPGIGKKIAQRVILELKDKVSKELSGSIQDVAAISFPAESNQNVSDAIAALAVLGYSSSEVASAMKKIDAGGMSADQIIKAVLKQMMN